MKGKIFSALIVGLIGIIVLISYFNKDISNNSDSFRKFESYNELETYVRESQSVNYGDSRASVPGTLEVFPASDAQGGATGSSLKAADYSRTNIQVAGVDELDIVKNDDKYIYTANQNKVLIIDAYPADSMNVVSELKFNNFVNGIFVDNNRLVVIEPSYGYSMFSDVLVAEVSGKIFFPGSFSKSEVKIHVYDIEGDLIFDPKLLESFSVEGNLNNARLINGNVYLISNKYIDYSNIAVPLFRVGESTESVDASSIYYPTYYEPNLIFTSVMAINLDDVKYEMNVFLLGGNNAIYVSEYSIYFSSYKSYDYIKIQEGSLRIIVEFLSDDFKSEAEKILNLDKESYIKQEEIFELNQRNYNLLNLEEKKKFEEDFSKANIEYYSKISKEYEKTVIHKIEINKLDISYAGSGEVPGYVLNQFSMDEYDGNFRIATTTGNSFGFGNFESSLNHVYVLNNQLEIIGAVENLAQGERIYSARFLGDKGYMVTFRQVDPLYVIDLSNSRNPKVLGFLKVTGFSNYLHPIGKNLLLGIGREATDEGRAQGLKISLFDVSDFENPKELDKYVVDSQYSYSEAEYDHKAVLFDDKRDLLVIPVADSSGFGNNWKYWQGAFAFTITDKDISLKGKISHEIKEGKLENYYGSNQGYVRRSLFMDGVLYTISDRMVKANTIGDLTFVSEVELPFEIPDYVVAY